MERRSSARDTVLSLSTISLSIPSSIPTSFSSLFLPRLFFFLSEAFRLKIAKPCEQQFYRHIGKMFPSAHKKVNLWFQQKPNNAQSIYEKAEGKKTPQKLQDVVWNDRKSKLTYLTGHKNSINGQVKTWTVYQSWFRRGLLVKSSYWDKGMKSGVYGIPDTEDLLFTVYFWHFYLHHFFHILPVGKVN